MGDVKQLSCEHPSIAQPGSQVFKLNAEGTLHLLLCPTCAAIVRDSLLREMVSQALTESITRRLNDAQSG